MRIVYVEDNIANVHLVKRVARMGKHEIINYIDGMDAFNNFGSDNPDLVLMDIQLAGELTGIEVVKKLRDQGYETPIFAVTAYAMVGDKERCLEAGCTGYMSKPLPVAELVRLFNDYDTPAEEAPVEEPAKVETSEEKPATPSATENKTQTDAPLAEEKPTVASEPEVKSEAVTSEEKTVTAEPEATIENDAQKTSATPVAETKTASETVEKTKEPIVTATDTQETDVTKPSRQTLMNTADTVAEGNDNLSEEDTPASVTTTDNNSIPPAKMI